MRGLAYILLFISAVPTGCGTDAEVVEENIEHQIRWRQEPGEIQDCHVFKLGNVSNVEVDRIQIKFPEGSHHVHLYRSTEPESDKVFDCFNGIDWTRWSLLVAAQTQSMDWQLPEGVTLPLEPNQQLLAQVHWLNTTDQPADEQIDISFHTTEESEEHLGVLFGVNKRINIDPGQTSRVEAFCQLPEGAKLHAMMGHFHARGSDYKVIERKPNQTTGREIYSAPDEPSFEFKTFSPAHQVAPGAGLQYECSFFNYGGSPLTWGSDTQTQEHCNMTAYFSPAEKISELCLTEESKLSEIKPTTPSVRVGQDYAFDVILASPEATAVTVALSSSDIAALTVPASVVIPAGQVRASFVAQARRPGHFEISASMDGARVMAGALVTGAVISEVFYNSATGNSDKLQWIEIANPTDMDLDLSGYSLGAGTSDYMRTRLGLPLTIPARGCIVVGGPDSVPANYLPTFALAQDLEPNLELGNVQAAGIGLFTTAGMSPTARPLDAVVYGGTNTMLRGPDGQIAPVWPGSTVGGSLKRMTDSVWTRSANPTPGVCEVLDAN
jgi:hypothetical protein